MAKAGDALVAELLQALGLDKARRKLERHLTVVQCILLDADPKSRTNPAVHRWVNDLKTAAYQADHVLDGFRCEALRRRAAQIRPHSTARKVLSYFTANSPVVFRLSMSRKMKDALEMIDELVAEMDNFHFLQLAEAPSVDHPQTHSQVDESEIVGRQDEKEQVVKILQGTRLLADKAGDALVADMLRAWGLAKAHRKLERHLLAIQCILLEADAKSDTHPGVCQWVNDLKTAAYQANDVLDGFRHEALRRHAAQIRSCSMACKMLSYFTIKSPVVFRLSMNRKMKNCLDMIDQLVAVMNKFGLPSHEKAPDIVRSQTHYHVDEVEVVGRQDETEWVVKILLDHSHDNSNDNNVMVLPIVGMGGIGKTTLAQLVHNDQRVKHHFELVLWVCVSDKFVIKEIIRCVIEVATMKKCDLTLMEALRKKLCGVLGKKRYLLVLDDVWNEDTQKWDDMRSLLCSHAGSGSAIIVTSCSDQVASIMGTHPPHQISLLNEDHSCELFHRIVFGRDAEKQEELISVAKSIVHKCKGLPLAIKTIAALLRSKQHSQWFSVLDSDVWKNDILAPGIVPAL